MTERIFKSMMNRLEPGEYNTRNLWYLYQEICPKSYRDTSKWENSIRFNQFGCMFEEKKYGFEYMFKGRIRYIGTNDLSILVVEGKM